MPMPKPAAMLGGCNCPQTLGQSYSYAGLPLYISGMQFEIRTLGYPTTPPFDSVFPNADGSCGPGYQLVDALQVENAGDAGLRYWPTKICVPTPGYVYTPAPPPPIPTTTVPSAPPAPPPPPAAAPLPTVPRDPMNPYAPPSPVPIATQPGAVADPLAPITDDPRTLAPYPGSAPAGAEPPAKVPWALIAAAAALLAGQ